MIYVGVDPGLTGACAVLCDGASPVIIDTPIMSVGNGDKVRRRYNKAAMADILRPYSYLEVFVVLESVHALPKQGVSSSFNFGEGLGIWEGIIAAFQFTLEMPSPQRWKKEMMADLGREKSAARYKAAQLFPHIASQFSRVKDDGRAEAILMAEWGRRLKKGGNG